MEVSSQSHALAASLPGKILGTHLRVGWVDTRARLDDLEKRRISCICSSSNLGSSNP